MGYGKLQSSDPRGSLVSTWRKPITPTNCHIILLFQRLQPLVSTSEEELPQFYSGSPFAVSSDGSFITCKCDESRKIVDSSNASIRSTIEGDSNKVTALAFSPNNRLFFSTSHSRQIKIGDLFTLKCVRSWKGHEGPVMGMSCHPSGRLFATAGDDMKVLVWDVDGIFCTHYFKGHKGVVFSVLFHPDPTKQLLFSASNDTNVHVWDLKFFALNHTDLDLLQTKERRVTDRSNQDLQRTLPTESKRKAEKPRKITWLTLQKQGIKGSLKT
ncbi:hypothetical protein DVH24_009845 [Malus domestica]|uniref:Uncharacterized protein n=1 Tax=Malus domestica TaxID=3750 RepID=A0A498KN09_MALDO|nr:hypothetical protein DVH24_009845 [Malus domestica]